MGSPEGPDDINNRLAEIAAELAAEARFKEPSAAERARARVTAARAAGKAGRARRLRQVRGWRSRRKATELRKPVDGVGAPLKSVPPPPPTARQVRRARRAAARAATPDRGYADSSGYPSVARSIISVVIIVALLIGVSIGLHYAFHHHSSSGSLPALVLTVTPPGAHLTG